jgi:hypothetical protein
MVKGGERLPLVAKSTKDLLGICPREDHLDSYQLSKKLIVALSQIDLSHTAVPNQADNAIISELSPEL